MLTMFLLALFWGTYNLLFNFHHFGREWRKRAIPPLLFAICFYVMHYGIQTSVLHLLYRKHFNVGQIPTVCYIIHICFISENVLNWGWCTWSITTPYNLCCTELKYGTPPTSGCLHIHKKNVHCFYGRILP